MQTNWTKISAHKEAYYNYSHMHIWKKYQNKHEHKGLQEMKIEKTVLLLNFVLHSSTPDVGYFFPAILDMISFLG